ncbi:hypothetical protein [uncultured Aquimarina sp.]|uniref:hypothetical protein n=1 Tax=uncultured Aquimarina sp. TaxID=575652 RepID=UPI00262532DD|nr:hypothetical protein [uncultured Aquimarina sp.]
MRNLKISLWIYSCIFLLASCEKTDITESKDNNSEQLSEVSSTEAKITLSNGNTIRFHNIDDGQLKGTFILEESDCNECSVLSNINKLAGRELSEQEAFWALSNPGTRVPSFLEINKKDALSKNLELQQQGWARDAALDLPIADEGIPRRIIACKNSDFTSSIAYGFLGTPEFVALDKTPNNYNGFVNDCASVPASYCNKGPRYRLHAVMNKIKKWKGKICAKSVQNRNNDHIASNISGGFCQSPPCDAYVGPELYFEYYSNGKWRSMKNPNGAYPEGFEVPANTTKVYSYSWKTTTNTSFRLRVKNAMGQDQFDFMMDREDVVIEDDDDGGNGGGNGGGNDDDTGPIPDYISVSGNSPYMIIDFTSLVDDQINPQISIPSSALTAFENNEGGYEIPQEFCGIRIIGASSFQWMNSGNDVIENDTFNQVSDLYDFQGINYTLGGIQFNGPLNNCPDNPVNWHFQYPLANGNPTIFDESLKLLIEVIDGEVIFLD